MDQGDPALVDIPLGLIHLFLGLGKAAFGLGFLFIIGLPCLVDLILGLAQHLVPTDVFPLVCDGLEP